MLKRNLFSILLFGIILISSKTNAADSGHELKFKVGLKDTLCYLANYFGDKQYLQDSARTDSEGRLTFKGKEPLPGGIYLFVFPGKTYFEMIIDKEQHFTMECNSTDVINSMIIKGSTDNQLFYDYLKFIQLQSKTVETLKSERTSKINVKESTDEVDAKIKGVDKAVIDYKLNYIKAHPATLLAVVFKASQEPEVPEAPLLENGKKDSTFAFRYYKQHYFDSFDFADERLLRTPIYHSRVNAYIKNLTLQMPDSITLTADYLIDKAKPNKETYKYMVWFITNAYETSNIMGMDAVFVYMAKKYYTKENAYWVDAASLFKIQDRAAVLEPILLGKKVKDLVLEDTARVFHSLYNLKSQWTVLFFWDPDCGHCKKSVPVLEAMYKKLKSKGVEIFAICTEGEMDKWRNFIKEHKLDWINVADPDLHNNFRHEFDISSTPQIFLLDKDKVIKAKKIDVETLEKILNRELGLKDDSSLIPGEELDDHKNSDKEKVK